MDLSETFGTKSLTNDFQVEKVELFLSPFQLQITAAICERTLLATWTTTAAPTLPTAAVREPTLLFVSEKGFSTEEGSTDGKMGDMHLKRPLFLKNAKRLIEGNEGDAKSSTIWCYYKTWFVWH